MPDTAIDPVPKQGKFRRALAAVGAWLQALDYTGFDYTLDRIEGLERELARLIGSRHTLRSLADEVWMHP